MRSRYDAVRLRAVAVQYFYEPLSQDRVRSKLVIEKLTARRVVHAFRGWSEVRWSLCVDKAARVDDLDIPDRAGRLKNVYVLDPCCGQPART